MNEDPAGLRAIGSALSNIFLNKDIMTGVDVSKINETETYLASLHFDSKTDEISVFKFGMNSHMYDIVSPTFGLNRVRKQVREGKNELSALTDELIIPVAQFQKTGKDINSFIQTYLKPLFYNEGFGGVNMSSIAYPCVLKKVNSIPAASEYYIIIVSNFKVRGEQENQDDYGLVRTAMDQNPNHATNFAKQLWQLNAPFYTSELMKIQSLKDKNDLGNSMKRIQAVKAICYQLGLKSLQGVSSFITSNLILHETGVGNTTYNLNDVNISFNKDEHIDVDSLVMKVFSSNNECLYSENVLKQSKYDEKGTKSYTIPSKQMDLGRVFDIGEKLIFQYLFFTSIKDEKGDDILPVVFLAEQNYNITRETIKSPEEQQNKMMAEFLILLFVLLCLAFLGFVIWKRRGKSRTTSIDFTIWPISHDHFMEIIDKKVSSYDCWYWRRGDADMNIPISGTLHLENKPFAKMFKYKMEVQIQDIDDNMDFSFRPDPLAFRNSHGDDPVPNQWYEVPVNSDGSFSFSANAYIEPGKEPDFGRENILKMKVTLRCVMIDDGDDKYVDQKEKKYKFIVKPDIDNRNLWVAFDPGTTGACVAYGASSNPTDKNDIFLAENEFDTLNDGTGKSHIFPSMIRLNHKSGQLFNDNTKAEVLVEGENDDFLFGNEASILWDAEGVNCFQSIKKLLGYTDRYLIVNKAGDSRTISGQDIAHLLVKGLYNHVKAYIENDQTVDTNIRNMFVPNGVFTPQRAIVAVPNNYTMVKIQEMVDSVKRTNKFKEVHFIYEAEAVMMTYFRQCWKDLPKLKEKIFVVYDMGGATINATAFKLQVIMGHKKGNPFIRRIEVETISKVGYGVGGDDIDFALIQILYDIPSVKSYVKNNKIDVQRHQQDNKVALIELVRDLKIELIAKAHHESTISHIETVETLYGHLREALSKMDIKINNAATEDDKTYLENIIDINQLEKNKFLNDYIYVNVKDAIDNLLSSIKVKSDIELVMSGRSILFPGIEKKVLDTIKDNKYSCHRWEGFDNDKGYFSAEKVKMAVATGACWFAMYSYYIKLINNKITSSFGYIDMIGLEKRYVPIINKNEQFNDEGYIELSTNTQSDLAGVEFIQMLGAESDKEFKKVLKDDIKHKYNILDVVRPAEIRTFAETIYICVDDKGNFRYKIKLQGKSEKEDDLFKVEDNPYSRLSNNIVKTEIINENSLSYIFSTINLRVDKSAIHRFVTRIRQQENKSKGGRF